MKMEMIIVNKNILTTLITIGFMIAFFGLIVITIYWPVVTLGLIFVGFFWGVWNIVRDRINDKWY